MNKQIPCCIDCITFAICKEDLLEYMKWDVERVDMTDATVHRAYNFTIRKKCSIIDYYFTFLKNNEVEYYDLLTIKLDSTFNLKNTAIKRGYDVPY